MTQPYAARWRQEALDFLAAACNHAEDPRIEARLDTIYRKLEKLIE